LHVTTAAVSFAATRRQGEREKSGKSTFDNFINLQNKYRTAINYGLDRIGEHCNAETVSNSILLHFCRLQNWVRFMLANVLQMALASHLRELARQLNKFPRNYRARFYDFMLVFPGTKLHPRLHLSSSSWRASILTQSYRSVSSQCLIKRLQNTLKFTFRLVELCQS
jgi:hypothetical protein